jgi:predicted RNA polymerase sigma factor
MTAQSLDVSIEHLLRELTPPVLGIVTRRFRDFAAAEDAVQEASIAAATQWPRGWRPGKSPRLADASGLPVDGRPYSARICSPTPRERGRRGCGHQAAHTPESLLTEISPHEDDTLLLLFMCCHPALTPASTIALTLRAVGGLTTAEIAHASAHRPG